MSVVGCIYVVASPYYDIRTNSIKFKKRPYLIIKEEDSLPPRDLSALPVSSISDKRRINSVYDIRIDKSVYPEFNLTRDISYIRTNKVQTINETDLIKKVCEDLRNIYPEKYSEIAQKVKQYYSDVL